MQTVHHHTKSKTHVRSLMHSLVEFAMWAGLLEMNRNPISLVQNKGATRRVRRARSLTVEQFRALLKELHEPFATMALLCVCLGLRISEALALKWSEVDWLQSRVSIRRGIVQQHVDECKTEGSAKAFVLADDLLERLKAWKQASHFSKASDWVFASPLQHGELPWSYTGTRTEIARAATAAELGHTHSFRHTYRSWLDAVRTPIAVQQKLMRHTDIRTTMNVYGDVAAMNVTQRHLAQVFPETYKDVGVRVDPLQKRLFGRWAGVYYPLFGVVGLVLLIACANVANLLLVRGDGRRKEIGVRIALGANRGSVIRQLLTEAVLLSLIGGSIGLLLSFIGVKLFNLWAPIWFPRETGAIIDSRVLLFTFGTCVMTGIAFGLMPAYGAVTTNVKESLQESGRSTATISRHRTRKTLVVTEIALAFVLLICTGLMINTLTRILRTSPGFVPEHLLTAQVRLTGDKYIDSTQVANPDLNVILPPVGQFCDQVLNRLRSTPGVEDVALTDWLPLLDGAGDSAQYASPGFTIAGQSVSTAAEKPNVFREGVSSDYFPMMSIPILRGRGVTEQDTASNAWVVMINKAMAKRYWPNQDPIGQAIKFDDSPDEKPRQIVGIVQDVKQFALTMPAEPEAFVPYQQLSSRIYPGWTEARVHKSIIIRTHADPEALMASMRRIISELAPESAIFGITTVERTVSQSATDWRFLSQILELFAAIALLLAVIGIYGVISYSIGERRHELGLRMAL